MRSRSEEFDGIGFQKAEKYYPVLNYMPIQYTLHISLQRMNLISFGKGWSFSNLLYKFLQFRYVPSGVLKAFHIFIELPMKYHFINH